MRERGVQARVYSHPLGNQGHGLGAAIGFRFASRDKEPKRLRAGSYLAVELNTLTPVPEWGNQEVFVFGEDPADLAGVLVRHSVRTGGSPYYWRTARIRHPRTSMA